VAPPPADFGKITLLIDCKFTTIPNIMIVTSDANYLVFQYADLTAFKLWLKLFCSCCTISSTHSCIFSFCDGVQNNDANKLSGSVRKSTANKFNIIFFADNESDDMMVVAATVIMQGRIKNLILFVRRIKKTAFCKYELAWISSFASSRLSC